MRHRHQQSTSTSHPQRRGEHGRGFEKESRRGEHSKSGFEDNSEDWDYGEDNYRSEHPYGEEEGTWEEDRQYRRNRGPVASVRSGRVSRRQETEVQERPRRTYRSTSRSGRASQSASRLRKKTSRAGKSRRTRTAARGFAAMPKSEVRRIAAMGGRASHGGGRPPGRKTRSRKTSRAGR